jgi:hypothetical protein
MIGAASAASYWFSDTIDSWNGDDVVEINNYPDYLKYTHDINDDVDFEAGDLVTGAYLALDFDFDYTDSIGVTHTGFCNYTIEWDNTEFSLIQFDESPWKFMGEVDNFELLTVGVEWLNDNGLLDVTLTVLNFIGTATAYLDTSTLYVCAQSGSPNAVPEPSNMILLGMGVIGIAIPGRKKVFKKM